MEAARSADTSYDRYARLVRRALATPVALVSFVEHDRQVFPGALGLPEPWAEARETPLSHSFCQHVVRDEAPLVVEDAREHELVRGNLAITDLGVVAYAGHPITDHTGTVIGSLCAIDTEPRTWSADDLATLEDLAAACSSEIAQRRLREESASATERAESFSQRSAVLLALSEALSAPRSLPQVAQVVHDIAVKHLGCLRAGIWLTDADDPNRSADLPRVWGPSGVLRFVDPEHVEWESAVRNARLPTDAGNPLGLTLLTGRGVAFRNTQAANERFPDLDYSAQIGVARAFEPLLYDDRPIGAMAFVWPEEHVWTPEDDVTRAALAAYAAHAVHRALLVQDRLDALVTLQSALLPVLPQVDHLDMAARYRPASARDRVGGDWYDAVLMPSGATNLMVGDVVGHDMAAAASMGQMRNMLRAIAWAVDDVPSANVARLDQAMADLGVEGMASLVYARVEQTAQDERDDQRTLRWTNAGHPPPLLVAPDGTARFLDDGGSDVMLSVLPDAPRTDHWATIASGSTVLLYTDGLVERRGEHLDVGLERLRTTAERHADSGASAFLDLVLGDLLERRLDDDVAVLAVHFGTER